MAQFIRWNCSPAFCLADLTGPEALVRNSINHVWRLYRLLRQLGRHDALFPLEQIELPSVVRTILRFLSGRADPRMAALRPGERLSAAFQVLGPSFIKFGQALSVRADLIGLEVAADLAELRDRLPATSISQVRTIIAAEFGRPVEDLFRHFDDQAIAAASIAQVHFAETHAGEAVAVKILRPGIEIAFRNDLKLFAWIARWLERHVPSSRRLRPCETIRTLAESVMQEMDLRLEAAAASELAECLIDHPHFRIPKIYWDFTNQRVLTMERVDGISIADREALIAANLDLPAMAKNIIQVFLAQTLEHGFFHADMHHGNLFATHDGIVVAVDFGIMGRLDRRTRLFMADMLHAFLVGDWHRAAEVHFAAGYVPADRSIEAFAQACRAVGEPIRGRPVREISLGRLLAQLFQITELFGMRTQPHLLLLQKTMVTVEGLARDLDPDVNFWDAAQPVLEPWARANLSPEARLRDLAQDGLQTLARLPAALREFTTRMEKTSSEAKVEPEITPARDWLLPIAILLLAIAILFH